jgi:UDP-N-acetylglucosamine/UDP-N-acetylgalactosamine diphosphorylase
VIEYSEFPEDAARAKNADGSRRFNAGNLAIHLLDVAFVERVAQGSVGLPFRRAEKVIPFVDESGVVQQPTRPNGVKLETFIFDLLPFARQPLVFEVDRAEEFSPVKNASGVDSLEASQRDQVLRACRWLEAGGVAVPRKPDGSPDCVVAISPRFALDADEVRAKASRIPPLRPGDRVYIK